MSTSLPLTSESQLPSNLDRLLTRDDVAQILGVSLKSVTKIQTGRFAGRPPLRPILQTSHVTRFRRADLEQWLLSGEQQQVRRGRGRPRKYPLKS